MCSWGRFAFFGSADQLPRASIERIGDTYDILNGYIALASFNEPQVRAIELGTFSKSFLAHVERQPFISNRAAQVSLKKYRVHVEFAPCSTGMKGFTAFR